MTKRTTNKLTVYRRHAATCPSVEEKKDLQCCECPLWAIGWISGARYRKSLDTCSVLAAMRRRDEILYAANHPEPPTGGGIHAVGGKAEVSIAEAERLYHESKESLGVRTRDLYATAVREFRVWLATAAPEVTLIDRVDQTHIENYLKHFAKTNTIAGRHGRKRSTVKNRLVHLGVFFNYCHGDRHWIPFSPTASREMRKRVKTGAQTKPRLPFSGAEIAQILSAVETLDPGLRDRARALVLLLLYSGMRISDATFLERGYLRNGVLNYWVIKTRKRIGRPFRLQAPALAALAALPASRVYFFQPDREDDYREARQALRTGESDIGHAEFGVLMPDYVARVQETTALVGKVLTLAGVSGACHRFRDTFAVNMLVAGADVFAVSQCLGHSDVKITIGHYLKGDLVPGYAERMADCTNVLSYQLPLAG